MIAQLQKRYQVELAGRGRARGDDADTAVGVGVRVLRVLPVLGVLLVPIPLRCIFARAVH